MFRSRMVAIGVATVWLVWGLIAIAFNQFQCGETKRTMKRAWDRRLSRNLGIPGGLPCASKKKSPRITQLSGGFRLCVCAVCLPGRIGGQGGWRRRPTGFMRREIRGKTGTPKHRTELICPWTRIQSKIIVREGVWVWCNRLSLPVLLAFRQMPHRAVH